MLKIITGPAGAGQSRLLCRDLVSRSLAHPSDVFIAIVPEQSTLKMQRDVVQAHPAHSVMNIDIVSFERLAYQVFDELGVACRDILNDTGKILLLRQVLEECREDLAVYHRKVSMPGFASEMKTVISELKQYALDDNDLFLMQEAAQQEHRTLLFDKLQDIRLVYRRFHEKIAGKYMTQEDILSRFAGVAASSGMLRGSHIYLDGFTGFTPVQYRLLQELLACCRDMQLTITLPKERMGAGVGSDLFSLSNRTMEKCRDMAEAAHVPLCVEEAQGAPRVPEGMYYRGADIRDEVRFIAGTIRRGVREGHMRFRDFAVICSDMEGYYHTIRNVFDEAGISTFIDYKTDLSDNVLARFLLAAMQLVTDRMSYESVFAFLKSDVTDLPQDDICLLENYCLEFGIRGIRAWSRDFTLNRKLTHGTDGARDAAYYWDLDEINRIRRQVMEGLTQYYSAFRGPRQRIEDYTDALKDLLLHYGMEEKMRLKSQAFYREGDMSRGKEYEQIYALTIRLLDQIRELMGEESADAGTFARLLQGALDEIKVGIIPPSLDAVVIGDLTRTRLDQVRVLFVAGANEGKLPAAAAPSGLFTRKEREFLKQEHFEIAPTVLEDLYTQHYYLYLMFASPKDTLYLTCAAAGPQGEEMLPSYITGEAGDILPGLTLRQVQKGPDELWPLQAAYRLAEDVRSAAAGYEGLTGSPEGGREEDPEDTESPHGPSAFGRARELLAYYGHRDPKVLQQILSGAFFSNRALALDPQTVLDLYGEVLKGSVSRYERFYECPFRHFLDYGLHLKERPEYEVQAADVGTIYHDSLERYASALKERGLSFRNISDEDSHEIASACVLEAVSALDSDIMTSTQRNAYLLQRIQAVTRRTTDVLRMQVRDGLYEPEYFEWSFAQDAGENAVFKGKVDRVDLYDCGDIYIKIIDYKSGSKKFSIRDIYTGQQLQLTAYLQAVVRKQQEEHPDRTVRVGGVYYYLIQDRFVRNDREAQEKFRMNGLTSCEPEAVHAIDTTLGGTGSSRIAEIGFSKNGLSTRSRVANEQEFEHLMAFVNGKIRSVADQIRQGDVRIYPAYESAARHACVYCEYRDVCKFEPGKWGSDFNRLPDTVTAQDMEREIYGRTKVDAGADGSN